MIKKAIGALILSSVIGLTALGDSTEAHADEVKKDGNVYYVVEKGDTLSSIAEKYKVDFTVIHGNNTEDIEHADLIFKGQKLLVGGADFDKELVKPYETVVTYASEHMETTNDYIVSTQPQVAETKEQVSQPQPQVQQPVVTGGLAFDGNGLLIEQASPLAQTVINQLLAIPGHANGAGYHGAIDANIDQLSTPEAVYVIHRIEGAGFGQTGAGYAGYDTPESHQVFVNQQVNGRFGGSVHALLKAWGTFSYGGY